MKRIEEMNVNNKKVILRCDLNVTIKDGKILSDERIIASLETINYLVDNGAKVILMSHLGKVKDESDKKDNSLYIVYKRLCELVKTKVYFCPLTHGSELESMIDNLNSGEVLLMENTRFEDINGNKESKCDMDLSKYWASLGDLFINDAFGMTHRAHASNSGITKFIDSGLGFLIEKELKGLDLLINPVHPFVVVMGGAKVTDKIELISNILTKGDFLLLGGGIANTFLSINYNIGKSLISEDAIEEVKRLMSLYANKIVMPRDVVVLSGEEVITKKINDILDEDTIYDIGEETIKIYEEYINKGETIFVNGTVGLYEDKRFARGTSKILSICENAPGKVIIGGGDALASAEAFKKDRFYFMSTGGGATLDYIGSEKLKCLE